MSRTIASKKNRILSNPMVITGLGLALCFGTATAFAQQGRPGEITATVDQQDSQAQAPPDQVAPPQTLTLPAGTVIRVRTNEWLSSDRNLPGDGFSAILDQPIVVDGWVVARRGQEETGRVSIAQKAGHGGGASQLGVQLSELTLVDGQQLPLQTQLVQTSAGTSNGRNAAIIGTTTGVGAVVGAAAGGGSGAAAGAIVGGAAGIIGVMSTRGKPTVMPPESVLSFRLQAPLTISTEKGQLAFQPVTQEDYDSGAPYGRPQHLASPGAAGYPPPYYGYPYAYGYPYPYYYPYPFGFGFYGGGFGGFGYGRGFGGFGYGRGFRGFGGSRGGGRR
jgi:hypothetical protein